MKNPFTALDFDGITGTLVGLSVLVFTAVILALVIDGDVALPSFSSDPLVSRNDALSSQINDLEIRKAIAERKQKAASKNRKQAKLVKELAKQNQTALAESAVLRRLIKNDKLAIALIEQGQNSLRLRYRDHIRASVIGKTYEKIKTPVGKEYSNVRISDVTPLGVSISHSNGASRLGFREMPLDWRKKLMFTAVDTARATATEQQRQAAVRNRIDRREEEIGKVRQTRAEQGKIATLRRQIAALNIKHSAVSLEASLARNKVSYNQSLRLSRSYSRSSYRYYNTNTGSYYRSSYRPRYRITLNSRKSVPGSLETWEKRAIRYERVKAKYSAKLMNLRARLYALAPHYAPRAERGSRGQ